MAWTRINSRVEEQIDARRRGMDLARRIVRALARDRHVVHVALAQGRAGDAHKLRFLAEILQGFGADITHRRTHATGELMQDRRQRALERHLALDALGYELQRVLDVLLK